MPSCQELRLSRGGPAPARTVGE